MMNILITGGLGYIGGRLSKFLSEQGKYNIVLTTVDGDTTSPVWLKKGHVVNLDLSSNSGLDEICRGVDRIIHLAAVNEIDSAEYPEKALLVNGLGTLKLLRAAERNGVRRFIYFSTAHVYRSPLNGHIDEKTLPRPAHPYSITHKVAEDFVLASCDKRNIEAVIFRLSNSFGPPVNPAVNRWTLIVNDLCRQAVVTRKLTLKSSGIQVRDFITLEDVCRATEHFMNLSSSKLDNGIFNLGSGQTLSILEITQLIARRCEAVLGFCPEIVRPEPRSFEAQDDLCYDVGKIKRTGFDLTSDFDKEIDETLKFCHEHFSE